jgi:glycosyltransferase involved in cell wall biosynthesis
VERLARALVSRGHAVTVVCDPDAFSVLQREAMPPAPADERCGRLRVVRLHSRVPLASLLVTHQLGRPVFHARRLRALFADERFDVVVFHNVSLVGGPGLLSLGGDALRVYMAHEHWLVCESHVLWRHDREPCPGRQCLRCTLHHGRPPQLWRRTGWLERQLRHVDLFLALSRFSADKHREFGLPREMDVVPCFSPESVAPRSAESPHGQRPYFLFAGRLERIKGLDDVIPVFQRYAEADLVIAGDGTHAGVLRQLAAGNPRVSFVGHVPRHRLDGLYQHAIAAIAPSAGFETFGSTVIEAYQNGTPVIARHLGAYPEMVAQGGGELFTTADELLSCLERLHRQPAYREQLARRGRMAFEAHWSEQVVVARFLDRVQQARARKLAVLAPHQARA